MSLSASASSPSPWQSSAVYPLAWQHPPEVSGIGKTYVKVAGGAPAVLGPVTAHTVDLGANAAQGSTPVSVWLEDNVQNVDPNNAAVVELRHDSLVPTIAASAPTKAAAAPIAVSFSATEAGAGGQAPTASGVKKAVLWRRQVPAGSTCAASPGPWTKGDELAGPGEGGAAFSGSFSVTPPADGRWCFYAQAEDIAGNRTAEPSDAAAAHGETLFDATPPVLSNLRVAELTPKKAVLAFESDEPAAARVEWGLSGALGTAVDFPEAQAFTATLESLPSPAAVYYKVTLVNRAGGIAASAVQSLTTPLDLAVSASIDNVIYPDQPIVIRLDNPGIGSAAYVIGGQAGTIPSNGSFSLFPPAVPGPATLTVTIDGATYSRAFIVDDPSRQYRIPRKVVAPGGEESSSAGSKILAAPGQPAATGAAPLASERSQLFLGFLAGIDPMAPGPIADLAAVPGPGRGQVTLSWKAVGDDAGVGRAMVYELRRSASPIVTEADFKNALVTALPVYPARAGTSQSAVVSGLPDGAQLHFALKALDEARNASPLGRVASAATLAFTASAETVGGAAAFELLSSVAGITVRRVESPGTLPVLRAAAQGFTLGGPLFEVLSPVNPLPAPGALTMRYDPAAVGTAEALLKIYRFDSEAGAWELLADSRVEPDRDLVTATVGHFSYITLLAPDVEAPTTELLADTGRRHLAPDGQVFLSAAGRLSLSARDPPVGALPGTGVSRTESRLDGAAFSDYDAPFTLPEGLRTLEYRSFDLAGNTETLRSAVLRLDAAAPRFALSSPEPSLDAAGTFTLLSTRAADGGLPRLVVSVSDALSAAGTGPGAGVARASVSLDGAPYAAFAGSVTLPGSVTLRLAPGRHVLRVSAEDNVGNAVTGVELPVAAGDLAPPRVALRVGSPRVGEFVAAGTVLTWTAEDDLLAPGDGLGAGAAFLSVLADGVPLAAARREPARGAALVATATLAGLADGLHSLSWSAHDAFGNVVLGTAALVLDSRGPAFLAVTPASGAFTSASPVNLGVEFADAGVGVSSASAALAVDGLARAVAATTAAARAEAVLAQGPHAALWTAADLLGNAASTATAFTADRTAPLVTLASPLGGERYVAGAGTIPVAFAVSDAISTSSAEAVLAQLADRGSQRGARPALVAVSSGAALDPLALDDGLWELRVSAVDSAGNSTQAVSGPFEVLHDLRPPRTNLTAGTPLALVAGASVVARGTDLTLASLDDMVGVGDALGLGVAAQQVSVDGVIRATFTAPMPGPGITFVSTFALVAEADGWHEVAYFATDVLGNIEASRVSTFGIDDTAPETSLAVLVGRQAAGPDALTFYASSGTNFALPAVDRAVNGVASGVDSTRWQDNGGTLTTYSTPFTLSEGPHLLAYQTQDRLGKLEVLRSTTVLIDANAPQSSSAFGLPTLVDTDGTRFVTPATTLSLSAQDPALPGGTAGSGVERIEISLDGAAFSTYTSPLTFAEGHHTVQFRAADRVGNVEAAQTLSLRSDASAPQTALVAQGGRQATGGTGFYASSDTRFALAAIDPLAAEVAAGVDLTRWQDNGGAFQAFSTPFSLSEGSHVLGFQSQDRVSNLEAPRSSTVFVDATAPASSYSIGDPLYTGVGAVKYITPATPVTLSAEDAALPGGTPGAGIDRIEVAIDGGAFVAYSAALNFAEGRHTVLFRAVDRVGNVEAAQALALRSDATAPETSLAVQGGKQVAGTAAATFYASSDTRFALPAADPVVADVASGVDFTTYRNDGGAIQPYSAPFTLSAGSHLLSYQSRDVVRNQEVSRSTTVFVDAAPPLTAFAIGAPSLLDSESTRYITPATPVSFTALDPALPGGTAGSGVDRIEVAIDGGAFAAYSAALTFAEGRHTVLFRAVDRVGNVEASQALALRSDATAPQTSLAVQGGKQSEGSNSATFYASSDTHFALPASDPIVADVASGVDFTGYRDNGGPEQPYAAAFSLPEGPHSLSYQSRDRVSNLETQRSTTVLVDATAPLSSFAIGTPAFMDQDGIRYIGPATPVSFTASDPALPGGAAGSGVERIEVAVDAGSFAAYSAPLNLPAGRHTVLFRAVDKVGNVEVVQSLALRSDASAPMTSLAPQGGRQAAGRDDAAFYASSDTRFVLSAFDPIAADVASGLESTRWQDSGGAFQTFSTPLSLVEGPHLLAYQSQDRVGNLEVLRSTTILVDATAPQSSFAIGTPAFEDANGIRYMTPATQITLAAYDPALPGGAAGAGVERIEVAVDGGAFSLYAAPLSFAEGRHTVQFRAIDRVGNVETAQTLALRSDASAPQTSLRIQGGTQVSGPDAFSLYASSATQVVLTATDPTVADVASGVDFTRWQDNGGPFSTYSAPLALTEGAHLLAYQSRDRVENLEVPRSTTILLDATAPQSAFAIGTPAFTGSDGTRFISPETPVSFSALDPALPGGTAGSGVERIEVAVDGGAFAAYTVALTFPEGRHTVQFRAIDRVGNIEATQTLALRSDNSAPQTSLAVQGGRQVAGPTAGSFYASSDTRIGLPATDPTVADVASGVGFTRWQDSGGAFQAYSSPIALAEGSHLLAFQSQDHVANLEALKSTTVFVDASAPNSAFAIGAPSFVDGDGTRYVTPGTPVSLVAQDPGLPGGTAGSGVERIEVAVDGGAFAAYTAALTFPEGRHTVQFRAIDRVGNVEATQSLALRSDSSAPQTSLAAVGGRQAAGPDAAAFYASGDSRFVFPASDPVAADVASGVGFTRWQDGSGAFQTYSAPVALAEGPHLIAYQSQDRVANLEILRSTTVLVDSSAPKSAFAIGTPAFVAPDGARYVAPGTQVTLSASDPALPGGTAGSGVERIEVAVDGAAFALYTAALTFPEGRHTVQFRAVDRVGNSEAPQTLALRSDASAPLTSLAAQGGRQVAAPDANAFYASLDTRFALPAADPVVSDVAAGVDTTRWQDNGGAFETYTAPLALAEGSHLLAYRSQDKVQNPEILRNTTVLIDGTAPLTAFSIGAPSYTDAAGVHYVTPAAPITFTAQDPALPGGAAGSGVERIEVALDAAGFQTYSAAVTLEEGRHSIRFRAYDKVGNVAAERTLEVRSDASAPLSSLAVQGGRQTAGPDAASRYASADTRIVLSASDPLVAEVASGVDLIRWRDNGGAFQTYAAPIALAEGSHVLTYQGQDKVQNVETLRSTTVLVDATAPHAAFQIGTPAFIDPSGTRYITPTTPVTFTAEDPALPGGTAGSGVERIEVSVDGEAFVTYTAALTFPEGRHAVRFRAFDRVENVEAAQTLALRSDASTPLTSLAIQGGRQAPGANATTFYASSATRYALPATDPVVADVASGVEFTRWQDNGGSVMSYTGPIAFPEGVHILTYASEDRVRNVEAQTAVTALVDAAPPITQFSLNGPRYAHAAGDQSVGGELFVSPTTGIDLLPLDPVSNGVASGLERLLASVDGGPFLPWMGAISFAQEGTHNVAYRGADRVGNEEGTRSVSVSVDATAPSTSLSFDGPALLRGPGATWEPQQAEAFITPVTKVILTTNDPTSAGIASGVKLTRLRIDSGPWQVYTGFFHLSNQGLHLVEFAAEDRVGNVETLVAKRIAVDNTAPTAGAAVNGPWLEAFGLNLLSTAATVSLAANDSPAAGVAVGLARILYRIEEGGLLEYTAPFALGPGSHTVRYHGVDLLGNAGSPQTLAVVVLRFLGGSLAATGFIDGSGTADVSGLIQTNGGLSLAGNFVATGGAEAFSVLLKGGAALTGPVTSAVRPLLSDWVDLPAIQAALTAANDNAALPAGTLSGGVLRLNSGQTVTLATGTYLLSGIDISGGAKVLTSGPVRIFVTGSVRLGGNSSLNEAGPARNLVIFGSGPSAELASAGASAIIYMPSAALSLSGGIRLGGSALAASMTVSGNSNATAPGLDTPAPAATSGGGGQGGKLAFASLGGGVGVAAVADASFVLREVYAFPNPAVGGARPTIHVAVGVADRVTIRIYDIAGQQVHQATLDSAPSVIDDGSGPKFAYELAWDGHIPSGVYLYTVVAEKGGQGAIRKAGKFAVVR